MAKQMTDLENGEKSKTSNGKWFFVAVVFVVLGVFAFSMSMDMAPVQANAYATLLRVYIEENDGRLPKSADDLLRSEHIRKTEDGAWEVVQEGFSTARIDHPSWFDFAWGAQPEDVTREGIVRSLNRPIVRPAHWTPYIGFEGLCANRSAFIGQLLNDRRSDSQQDAGSTESSQ